MAATEKRPPVVTASASGTSSEKRNVNPNSKASQPPQHFAISDGRTQVGTVDLTGGRYVAVDLDGNTIGSFPSLKSAAAASFDGGRR